MEKLELKPGLYILTEDVTNPSPDRRSKDWHKAPIVSKGKHLVVRSYGDPPSISWLYSYSYHSVGAHDPLFNVLATHMSPVSENDPAWVDYISRGNDAGPIPIYAVDILQELVNSGKVTLDDLRQAYTNWEKSFDNMG